MTILEEIYAALLLARPDDLTEVRRYIEWIRIRRRVNDRFYFRAHWVYVKKAPPQLEEPTPLFGTHAGNAHWV
jgi:hypothetical protein